MQVVFCSVAVLVIICYGYNRFTELLALPEVDKLMKATYWSTGLPVSGNWMDQ